MVSTLEINHYIQGVVTAALGVGLILWGLPSCASLPHLRRSMTKKQAAKIIFYYCNFFLSCTLLGALIAQRVISIEFGVDFGFFYLVALPAVGLGVAFLGLLFYRLILIAYGIYVGMLLGQLFEAILSNATRMNDSHQWGRLLILTCGLLFGALTLKSTTASTLPRLIFAVAGAGILAMSPGCFAFLPSSIRDQPALAPWVRFMPEIAKAECTPLPSNQTDVYIDWAILVVILIVPVVLFKLLPWLHSKFHVSLINENGCGLRIKFRPNIAAHERQGLVGAIGQYRRERRVVSREAKAERKARKAEKRAAKKAAKLEGKAGSSSSSGGSSSGSESDGDDAGSLSGSDHDDSRSTSSAALRHPADGMGSQRTMSNLTHYEVDEGAAVSRGVKAMRARIEEELKREEGRIEVLTNKFDMLNKQRDKLLGLDVDEAERDKPPMGMVDWRRGTPDKVTPAFKILLTRVLHFFIMGWGLFWLVWLCGWGYNLNNFIGGLSWLGFVLAEIVNYFLGIIYNFNFWTATERKRKSLYALEGFMETVDRVRVDTLLFHYNEDPDATQRTLQGMLMMKRTPNVYLTHRICDDSFGTKRSNSIKAKIAKEREALDDARGSARNHHPTTTWQWLRARLARVGRLLARYAAAVAALVGRCCSSKRRAAAAQKKAARREAAAAAGATPLRRAKHDGDATTFAGDYSDSDEADLVTDSEADDVDERSHRADGAEREAMLAPATAAYVDDAVSQADLDRYPFPEFDALFYPLPEALEKDQLDQMKAALGGGGAKAHPKAGGGGEKEIKQVGKLGWDYDPTPKGKEIDDDDGGAAGAQGGAGDEPMGFYDDEKKKGFGGGLLEPLSDRLRKIYEKNRRILRHLALGTDFNGDLYDFEPTAIGREVVMRVMETMEVYLGGPVVPVLHLKEEMFRDDCARGSVSVTFELRHPSAADDAAHRRKKALKKKRAAAAARGDDAGHHHGGGFGCVGDDDEGFGGRDDEEEEMESIQVVCDGGDGATSGAGAALWEEGDNHHVSLYPNTEVPVDRVKIVARIKPAVHHNKAGNVNNVLYNTEVLRKGQFLLFLDNDMRPEPDYLLYTLPWFYVEGEPRHWELNDNLSFVQTPQVFETDVIAKGDKLGNANQVFFSAIQPGRDGENACAFAGTNAIFAKRALLRVGGVPYESQTEDAHTSIRLHKAGFVSYYVNLPLVVGDAPTTVASRQLQFLRWVKGSIQLWWAQYYQPPKRMVIGDKPPELPREERPGGIQLLAYAIDTMTWPLSAISALIYMFCALVFAFFAEAPVEPHSPFDNTSFLWIFLPYLCFRMLNNWIALRSVKSSSIWVAQEVWYSGAFTAFLGILDALYEKWTGRGITGWKSTGEGTRTTRIEYFNIVMFFLLLLGVLIRGIIFATGSQGRIAAFGSAFFASIILIQLWPQVSMSLYELVINHYKPSDEKRELGRFTLPNWLIFTVILVAGISAGVLLN